MSGVPLSLQQPQIMTRGVCIFLENIEDFSDLSSLVVRCSVERVLCTLSVLASAMLLLLKSRITPSLPAADGWPAGYALLIADYAIL